jgi:hypothetical protein
MYDMEMGRRNMKYAFVGLLAVLIAGVFVLAAVPMGSLGKVVGVGSDQQTGPKHLGKGNQTGDHDNETEDMDNVTAIAGGGGWQMVNMSDVLYKDTFGCFIGEQNNMSVGGFVFQARDQGVTIHATNFTHVDVDNTSVENATIVTAKGWALYDKSAGFWFTLILVDNGTTGDMLKLFIYKDLDKNWTMDESSPLLQWVFESLGGGNIWAGAEAMEAED